MMRIGIISDTHGLLRPSAIEVLTGVSHIIHAGDIGAPDVTAALREIAPTAAIRGNIDTAEWARDYRDSELLHLGGRAIYVLHNLKELAIDPAAEGVDIVISGHSHQPRVKFHKDVLYLNPGSAGPRRFALPITLATLDLSRQGILPRIHEIAP